MKGLVREAAADEVWDARQQQMAQEFVCKGTMLPSEIARFAERVRGLGGESVTQGTGIMIAGFPAAAAEGLVQLRREMEAGERIADGSQAACGIEARLLGHSAG